jgi:hypothetical protein
MKLTQTDIDKSFSTNYDLCNSVLYELCKHNFEHTSGDAILAKTILIGKVYAVSLDRGKDKGKSYEEKLKQLLISDDFYQNEVVPLFMGSDIDNDLVKLKNLDSPKGHEKEILKLHNKLKKRLLPINQEDKISFCSKYLHFHLPNLFFIFDRRAKSVINQFISKKDIHYFNDSDFDAEYSNFYSKALHLQGKINKQFSIELTPRQIDNLFLVPANEILRQRLLKKKLKDNRNEKLDFLAKQAQDLNLGY